ncbi:hypothetical protein WJX77_003215 [Trebouxia sp. C0004]
MQTERHLYSQWLFDCKEAAQELRQRIKQVKSCRIQCGDVLGSALAVVMALEQAVLMDRLDEHSQEVSEVFAEAVSTIELAQTLVQVCESRWQLSGCPCFSSHQGAEGELRKVSSSLRQVCKRAIDLQKKLPKDKQQDGLCRFAALGGPALLPSAVQKNTMKQPTSSCLRQGCRCIHVHCILYIDPVAEHQSLAGLGQVWWTLRDDSNSTVYAHDVAKGITTELPDICSDATVSCLGLDRAGRVWMGCQGGLLQVWCPVFQRPICQGQALSAVSIRCMAGAEEADCMWLGTDNGCVSQACLSMPNTKAGSQPIVTLVISLHQSIGQNNLISGPRSVQSPADLAKQPCRLAHDGPVHEIMLLSGRVITRGGRGHSVVMKEWTSKRELIGTHTTCKQGPITCMTALHQPPSQHKRGNQAGQRLLPDTDSWQLLTGHTSGQVKMWSAAAVQPLRPLAILGAPTVSPVRSLVVLADQQLLCFAHADGHLALHTAPHPTQCPNRAESLTGQDLPILLLQHAVCQAHQLGLEQCVKCEVGLVSVGSSGTILMWSEDQLTSTLQQPCFLADDRDSEQEPEQELDPTSLDDHHACSGAAWLLQRFLGSASVLAMKRALSGSSKDKPEEPHSLNKEVLGGADAQQASSAARMSIGACFRASALGRSSGATSKGCKKDHLHQASQTLASIFTSHSAPRMVAPTDCPASPRRSASFSPGEAAPASVDFAAASASRRSGSSYGLLGIKGHDRDVPASAGTVFKTLPAVCSSESSALELTSPDLVTASSSFSALPHVQFRRLALPSQTAADFCLKSTREAATSISFTHDGHRPQADMMLLVRKGYNLPESLIPRSDVPALHHPPYRSSSQLSAFHTIQKASSVSRRALLANLLHRMSIRTQPPSGTASARVSDTGLELSPAASADCAQPLDSVGRLLSSTVSAQVPPGQTVTPTNSPMFSALAAISVSLGRQPSLPLSDDALQTSSSASQEGCVRPLKRTISDVALDALESVESLKCPIIEYSHLDIKRRIGAGSVGQVYLAKWQETDVAVKVMTQMQKLSPLREIHGQSQSSMQPCHGLGKHANTQAAGQAEALVNQHMGIDLQVGLDTQGIAGSIMALKREEEVGMLDTALKSPMSDQYLLAITTLEREVSIMAAIRHPNVVMFMGLCLHPVCIVIEFCPRGSLSDVIQKAASDGAFAQQLQWPKRLSMALDAAKGMLQLHSHKPPILHRDLKSPNLLVDKHWRVKVTDFNLSSMLRLDADSAGLDSSFANNPRWLAPEVIAVQNFSKAADVYSFGIILWELMTWQVPWDDINPFQIMMLLTQQQARPDIPPLDSLPGGTWPGMQEYILLMQACWEDEPDKRPDFESIIADLRGMLRCTAATRQRSQALKDLPCQMSSSTWPDSPRQLAEQSLTPLGVSPLPPPHPNPLTNIPDGFSSALHKSGLQAQNPRLTSVGSLVGPHRLHSDSHMATDPKDLGSDLKPLGSGPLGVVSHPDTPSLKFQGAVPGYQHAHPALSGTKSWQSLSLSEGNPRVPQMQSPFAQTDGLPVVSSPGPCSISFSSAHGAVPRQSPCDTMARPAAQQSPFADAPVLRTLKALSGSMHNSEPHEGSHHAGDSPKTGLIQGALQNSPNAGPANSIMPHPTAIEGSFDTGPHAGTHQRSSNTDSPGAPQSSTKAPPPPPSNAKAPHPPDTENNSASQRLRTASGGLTHVGCQQTGSGLHISHMPSRPATASSSLRMSNEAQRSASRLQYVTGADDSSSSCEVSVLANRTSEHAV